MRQSVMVIAGITLVILALGILAGAYVMFSTQPATEPSVEQPSTGNPFGQLGSGTVVPNEQVTIMLTDGSTATIPDFSKGEQPPAASDVNGYQVAGAADAEFQIVYFPLDSGFIITLNAEPIGQTRRDAEDALRTSLGLSNAELCKLRIDVGAPYSTNDSYAGANLGLSFCPGSVALP